MNNISPNRWNRNDLLKALQYHQFIPYFQPKVDLTNGDVVSVEILARWAHPHYGLLVPEEFIGSMENEALISWLTRDLLKQSLALASTDIFRAKRIGLAINVSPVSLQEKRTPFWIHAMSARYHVDPSRITVEVTETACGDCFISILRALTYLQLNGFKISSDDFGIGYSSLKELQRMPFTELKIDRMFVSGITKNTKSEAILESIVELANKLHLDIVAEGIETCEELCFIKKLGCAIGQGFYLGRPMNGKRLCDYLSFSQSTMDRNDFKVRSVLQSELIASRKATNARSLLSPQNEPSTSIFGRRRVRALSSV